MKNKNTEFIYLFYLFQLCSVDCIAEVNNLIENKGNIVISERKEDYICSCLTLNFFNHIHTECVNETKWVE